MGSSAEIDTLNAGKREGSALPCGAVSDSRFCPLITLIGVSRFFPAQKSICSRLSLPVHLLTRLS